MEFATALAIWLPFILSCFSVFAIILYRSLALIIRSRSVRSSATLMLIYIAIDLCLFACPFEIFSELFPTSQFVVKFAQTCSTVGDAATYAMVLMFLARVVIWLESVSRNKRILTGIFYACWILLAVFLVSFPFETFATSLAFSAYFLVCRAVLLAIDFVVFVILAEEHRRISGASVFCREKMLSAYFCLQIATRMLSMYTNLLYFSGVSIRKKSYVLFVVMVYVLTLLHNIVPPVLIFIMISRRRCPLASTVPAAVSYNNIWDRNNSSLVESVVHQ